MVDLKYAWLQETLAELIHHTTEARLYSVSSHLHAALQEVRQADNGTAPRSSPIQVATVRLALQDCQSALTELGKHRAAHEVALALQLLPEEHGETRGGFTWPQNDGHSPH